MILKETVGRKAFSWPLLGFLVGGLVGGTTALVVWMAIPSKPAELPFPLASAMDIVIVAGVLGAWAGVIVGGVGGFVASAAHASQKEVADAVIEGSFASGASTGLGATVSALFDPTWAPIVSVMIGPGAVLLRKVGIVSFHIGARRALPAATLYVRGMVGIVLGLISGLLTEGLVIGLIILSLPSKVATSLIAGFAGAVGPAVGTGAGGVAAIGISGAGGSSRRAAYFAIEASAVATVATSAGIVLTHLGLGSVGIVVATTAATLWCVTRGRLIRPPGSSDQRPKRKGRIGRPS